MRVSNQTSWPAWPNYNEKHQDAVLQVVKANQIFASLKVNDFEKQFASFLGTEHAVGVSNATTGLHLALAALGVGKGDEVIVTPYSWISSASAILMQNAIPIFVDIDNETFGLNPDELEKNISDKTKAVICVHMFGNPCKIKEISEICSKRKVALIEDASHAHGALHAGQAIGTFGNISVFSLHQRKNLSVGEGGIVVSNDYDLSEKVRRLRSFGDDELSYNYRMTEFAGALGIVGLESLENENDSRNKVAAYVREKLQNNKFLQLVSPHSGDYGVFHAALLEVIAEPKKGIDSMLIDFQKLGVPIKKTWRPLHLHPHFNPKVTPARGLPWQEQDYDGFMKGKKYAELFLPVTTNYIPNKLLELSIHPPTSNLEVDFFLQKLEEFTA